MKKLSGVCGKVRSSLRSLARSFAPLKGFFFQALVGCHGTVEAREPKRSRSNQRERERVRRVRASLSSSSLSLSLFGGLRARVSNLVTLRRWRQTHSSANALVRYFF